MSFFKYLSILILVGVLTSCQSGLNIPTTASPEALRFLEVSKQQIGVVTKYDFGNGYYGNGGFPPADTGVCSDVIWRAYRDIGLDFRALVQAEIAKNSSRYGGNTDANINYRRVGNLATYFTNTAQKLDTAMIPGDEANLAQWQPGDIVIFEKLPSSGLKHIGIITDRRRADGVPYMLDNHGKGVNITITPLDWKTQIIGHFRIF